MNSKLLISIALLLLTFSTNGLSFNCKGTVSRTKSSSMCTAVQHAFKYNDCVRIGMAGQLYKMRQYCYALLAVKNGETCSTGDRLKRVACTGIKAALKGHACSNYNRFSRIHCNGLTLALDEEPECDLAPGRESRRLCIGYTKSDYLQKLRALKK